MRHLVIDTSYLIYRSYFAYPQLTSNGQATGALYGFIKTVFSLIKEFSPDTLSFACDRPEKTWRHEILADYKAGRPEIEQQMRDQIPTILQWCQQVTPNFFSTAGYEADDLIFTICLSDSGKPSKQHATDDSLFTTPTAEESDTNEYFIFSSDKDLYQLLVQPNLQFVSQNKGKISLFGPAEFRQKYQLEPWQWVDFKALVGDPSDNLKGVGGIGSKTAVKILQETSSLQILFEVLGLTTQISTQQNPSAEQKTRAKAFTQNPKNQNLIEKIKAEAKTVEQTYKLATLQTVADTKLVLNQYDFSKGLELIQQFNLSSLVRETQRLSGQTTTTYDPDPNALF